MNILQPYRRFLFLLTAFLSITVQAQQNFAGYFEPAVELSYQVSSKYSHSFGIENRTIIYRDNGAQYSVKQIDISHFSEYQIEATYALGLGLKYRWENLFDSEEENELRLQQQVVYKPERSIFKASHRLRTEQRLYASDSKHRFRYQLGYTIPLAHQNPSQPYLKVATESLLEIAKTQKPELEQRFGVGFGWLLTPETSFKLGIEYQLADYIQDLNHELFLLAEFGIKL
jgi:hypothetical protein